MSIHSVLLGAMITVKKVAVLGAGTMGAQIAAHLANAGIPTLLLDIVPREETQSGGSQTGTLPDGRATAPSSLDRNRIARAGLEAAKKARPAASFTPDLPALVSV